MVYGVFLLPHRRWPRPMPCPTTTGPMRRRRACQPRVVATGFLVVSTAATRRIRAFHVIVGDTTRAPPYVAGEKIAAAYRESDYLRDKFGMISFSGRSGAGNTGSFAGTDWRCCSRPAARVFTPPSSRYKPRNAVSFRGANKSQRRRQSNELDDDLSTPHHVSSLAGNDAEHVVSLMSSLLPFVAARFAMECRCSASRSF